MRRIPLAVLISALAVSFAFGQDDPIFLVNPSFEDVPRQGKAPRGWQDCGFPAESPPDVQPNDNVGFAFFKVTREAYDGGTYLGMVVRDNDTWERVSQRLSTPLEPGKCYEFSLHLCRSELYVSPSRTTMEETNYTTPARLRIWGGSGYCNQKELLAETSQIINTRWLQYDFRFEPTEQHTYIVLEAFYNTPTLFPYNGNVLIDNASAIVPVPCNDEVIEPTLLAVEEPKKDPEPAKTPPSNAGSSDNRPVVDGPSTNESTDKKERIIKELEDRGKLVKGQTIRIDKLYFEADSSKIKETSFEVLDEIYEFLATNDDVVVEIGGHTNGNPPHDYCDRLSTARAKAVADYLFHKGIPRDRLQFKGYGKRYPVATNKTQDGRTRNQRVEINILSFDG